MKQKMDRYEMHKYWGKKPSKDLNILIEQYSKEKEIVFDPFAGYGVFCIESYISNRNVVLNDLNPIATFIQKVVLDRNFNLEKLNNEFKLIKADVESYINSWFTIKIDGVKKISNSVLRNKNDDIIKCKYDNETKKNPEYTFSDEEKTKFRNFEENFQIKNWFPTETLFENSRITVKEGTRIQDLFTKRTLDCHAALFNSINKHSSGPEKNLLLISFTANLANCSRLVPPISSRGDMAPGAWMTGFYTGETYIENNVFHYFENRFEKIIKGKLEYLQHFNNLFENTADQELGNRKTFQDLVDNQNIGYYVQNSDIKHLNLPDNSIDYIFTDPPYGDSVPYFEQSIIWNSWLQFNVDYENEIVISNSKSRKKNNQNYSIDIKKAILEIYRILKPEKYFTLTFHSLSGLEWNSINNACLECGFVLHDFQWLVQKTFTPRQLNRAKTVKGDVLITLRKPTTNENIKQINYQNQLTIIKKWIIDFLNGRKVETNDVFLYLIEQIYKDRLLINEDINFFDILSEVASFENDKWSNK